MDPATHRRWRPLTAGCLLVVWLIASCSSPTLSPGSGGASGSALTPAASLGLATSAPDGGALLALLDPLWGLKSLTLVVDSVDERYLAETVPTLARLASEVRTINRSALPIDVNVAIDDALAEVDRLETLAARRPPDFPTVAAQVARVHEAALNAVKRLTGR